MDDVLQALDEEQRSKLQQFMEITGINEQEFAFACLQSVDFDVHRAMEQHFGGELAERNNAPGDDDIVVLDGDDSTRVQAPVSENNIRRVNPLRSIDDNAQPSSSLGDASARSRPTTARQPAERRRHSPVELSDDDMDVDDYAYSSHDQDLLNDDDSHLPLIPEDCGDVRESLANFAAVFDARYRTDNPGRPAPNWYMNSLTDAVREAFDPPGRGTEERRPLALYFHHDNSVAANIFPPNILCTDAVTSLLRHQFVLWPWDVTKRENENVLMEWLNVSNLEEVRRTLQMRARNRDVFPMLVLVIKEKGVCSVADVVYGTDTQESVVQKLMAVVDSYTQIRLSSMADEAARRERDRLREEQHAEYQASLAADRARAEQKEREMREQMEAEDRKRREEEDEQIRRKKLESSLPDEPPASDTSAVSVKFRLPSGEQVLRRFRRSESLTVLFHFLESKGFSKGTFKFFNSDFPKKDITSMNGDSSFGDLKWPAREQIFVEEI